MKQILKNYRIKPNKEMFDVYEDDIKILFNFFNELNTIFDTPEKLNWYIHVQYPEYFKKRKYIKNDTSSSEKSKRKKTRLFVDTSY